MAKKKCEILVINQIAQVGLKRFPAERYAVVKESKDPWAILVRSQDLHKYEFGPSLRAVGRAGAGVNNIPVPALSKRGIPVFNAPGAIDKAVEKEKKQFAGFELPGHTLGVIGLGKIGSLVADAAIRLGMNVLGHDPHITVEAAWSLPSQVRRAHTVDAVLLNFSRDGVVADDAVLKGLANGRLRWYVTDFPSPALLGTPGVIALPH